MGDAGNAPTNELGEIKSILEQHEKRISYLENLAKEKPTQLKKGLSIKELILEKNPRSDVEKTLVLGYYLEHYKNTSPFNADDLEDLFREAKENVPDNINYKVIKNIEKGFMMESKEKKDKKKAWTLTTSGQRFVENGLKKED